MQHTRILTGGWTRLLVAAAFALMPVAAAAQSVTSSDIQRLQDEVFQAGSDLSRARSSNPDLASRLQSTLDDLRDEVIYLKVKLRKEGSVSRSEYTDVRDRLQDLRAEARGENVERTGAWTGGAAATGAGAATDRTDQPRTQSSSSAIPAGQELDVRLQTQLSSATAQVEDRFEATTVADLFRGNEVLIPAGSVMRGVVRSVQPATRTNRRAEMTVSFDQITVRGRAYPMRGTITEAIQGEGIKGEAGRIGAGAGVGAIIGGIIGGVRGALLGILIGGGGTIAATEGKEVTLDPGTILRVRLDTPPNIR
ncbi:MAG TPA: hypothetical protein VGD94_06040 [Vicinamibacterales bacterium]